MSNEDPPGELDGTTRAFLARLDERTARMVKDIGDIRENVVFKSEFNPVRLIAYGLVALVMVAVVGALMAQLLGN